MRRIGFFLIALSLAFLLTEPRAAYAENAQPLTLARKVQALVAAVGRLKARLGEDADTRPLSGADTGKIIDDSIAWLIAAQEEDGHFRYEYLPYEDRYLSGDNIVRQAGAFYELGEVLRRGEKARGAFARPCELFCETKVEAKEPQGVQPRYGEGDTGAIATAMERSIGYFERLSQKGEYDGATFTCVTTREDSTQCKLGATALVLTGMISLAQYDAAYRAAYDERIAAYGVFLAAMKKEGAGFRNIFDSGRETQSNTESSYSNGETLLALARYDQYHPEQKTRRVVDEAFEYFKDDVPFDTPLYLWVMAALVDMSAREPRIAYKAYAREYTDWRVGGFADMRETNRNVCAYVEGVVLAYDILDGFLSPAALAPYRDEIEFWLAKERTLQVGSRDQYRVMFDGDRASFAMVADPERAYGGFLTGETEFTQRIDFTQHCLNAYLVWNDIQGSSPE